MERGNTCFIVIKTYREVPFHERNDMDAASEDRLMEHLAQKIHQQINF